MIIFQPSGRRGYVASGKTIKEASIAIGVDIEGVCGDLAVCGKCKVRIEEGYFPKYGISSSKAHVSPISAEEEKVLKHQLQDGYRLSCQTQIYGDVVVFVPEESRLGKQVVRKQASQSMVALKPAVRKYTVDVSKAPYKEIQGDWEKLQAALAGQHGLHGLSIDILTLIELQCMIYEAKMKLTVSIWHDKEVIKTEPGIAGTGYGLAVDVGTTTIAGYLCDLTSGEIVATSSLMNPQVIWGEDVMSRITYTMTSEKGLADLNSAVIDGINEIVEDIASKINIDCHDIVDMTLVGNTCMHHLFLNINPEYLGRAPFPPAFCHSLDIKARELGMLPSGTRETGSSSSVGIHISPGAYVHVLPIVAGFVGADHMGVIIDEEPYNQKEKELIIDIGTNGELVLGDKKKLVSSSCATGPAFEGAEIKFGMRAAPGAIEKIEIDRITKEVRFQVIGKKGWSTELKKAKAKGICGSGIIDVLPQLFNAGIIDRTGRFKKDLRTPRFTTENGPEFVIAWADETSISQDIVICQEDVRNIQLAKAAMYAGAKIMMRHLGIDKVDKVILAGAFGSYIDKKSAACLGLFPDCDLENISTVGNAAGDGARAALLNVDKRLEADKVARQIEYIELTKEPDFDKVFAEAMWLPHMKDVFPHIQHLLSDLNSGGI